MLFDEGYKERLKEYCEQRIGEKGGSIRAWARQMGIDKDTIKPWREGTLTEPIKISSLEALAQDRNESPEQTRDWLEDKPSLLEQVCQAPIETVAQIHRATYDILRSRQEADTNFYQDSDETHS